MNKIVKPKFLKGIELPQSYFQVPDPYHDAPSNGVSLLALSKYARSQNKRIVDLSRKEINDCCGKAVMKNYGESIKNLITNKRLRGMVNI